LKFYDNVRVSCLGIINKMEYCMYNVNENKVAIKTTAGELFRGFINIKLEERLSDVFTQDDAPFVILKDKNEVIRIINKAHIVWVQPIDNIAG